MSDPRAYADGAAIDVLSSAAAALARGEDLDGTLRAIVGAAVDGSRATSATLFVQDPDRPALELAIAFEVEGDELARLVEAVAADPGHPIAYAGSSRTPNLGRPGVGASAGDPARYADLPLVVARGGIEQAVGVLTLGWADGSPLAEDDARLVAALADLAAVAVDSQRLASSAAERSEWFERMAHTDPLTGLANARTIDRVLELELARASRANGEVSIAVFDVDDFGATNEAAGSAAGDDVLRQVAAVLAESVRLVDTVARYGGDEFVLVAPGSAGLTVARRIQDGIARLPEIGGRRVTVSAGLARFPADGSDATELLAAASAAARQAREEGHGSIADAAGERTG